MPSKIKATVRSLRLRTLPLSLAGVILGVALAADNFKINPWVAAMIFTTTVFLQILSNISNELGDTLSGTDTQDRQGPQYALGSGEMTVADIKRLIVVFVVLCIVSGLVMIRLAFGSLFSTPAVCLEVLGALAIVGAMKYTLGKNPYGYRGFGDISVFIFFGLVSVLGSYYVAAGTLPTAVMLLPASAIGLFSVGVLNINNIRDMKTDAVSRVTVAMKLGVRRAKIYQTILIVLGWVLMYVFCVLYKSNPHHVLANFIVLPLLIFHLRGVWSREDGDLDPFLPLLVMSTFLLSILFGAGLFIWN